MEVDVMNEYENLSIEELEVEIEDLDVIITRYVEEQESIRRQIKYLSEDEEILSKGITKLRGQLKYVSDLIREKQREEAQ
jgi:cell division protein FtsB